MKEIPLTQGYVTTVDNEDYERLSRYKWCYHSKGYAARTQYACGKYSKLLMHRDILGATDPNIKIDHKNNDGLCNERWNLRTATIAQNNANIRVSGRGTSKYKGVCWRKHRKRWFAQIMVNYKSIHIGCFDTEIEAALAYNEKAIELFGEFAKLNIKI